MRLSPFPLSSRQVVTFLISHKKGWCRRPHRPNNRPVLWQRSFLSETLSFLSPERTRISYFIALTSATYVVLPKENHMHHKPQPSTGYRGSRGICGAPFRCPTFTVRQPLSPCHPYRSYHLSPTTQHCSTFTMRFVEANKFEGKSEGAKRRDMRFPRGPRPIRKSRKLQNSRDLDGNVIWRLCVNRESSLATWGNSLGNSGWETRGREGVKKLTTAKGYCCNNNTTRLKA